MGSNSGNGTHKKKGKRGLTLPLTKPGHNGVHPNLPAKYESLKGVKKK